MDSPLIFQLPRIAKPSGTRAATGHGEYMVVSTSPDSKTIRNLMGARPTGARSLRFNFPG